MENFVCPVCGNKDSRFIGMKNGSPYCRLCISMINKTRSEVPKKSVPIGKIDLNYKLTEDQRNIAKGVVENFQNCINSLIYAVTGAGKTELVFGVIQYALENGMQVGFAVPRREVVIELADRIKVAFSKCKVVSVYGGHHEDIFGDIIVLTTHQLYRYKDFFDLLILDEIDAFPFKDNDLLNSMFFKSIKGNFVMMSATPNKQTLQYFERDGHSILTLKTRYHHQPIPVPKIILRIGFFKYIDAIRLLKNYISNYKQVFVFCPTISKCEQAFKILSAFVPRGNFVHSKRENQSKIIQHFKDKKYDYLVTTAVLERGITVKGLQVIIIDADSGVYDEYSLVQIAGRAGRKMDEPTGDVYFLANKITKDMDNAITTIKECNLHL